MGRLAELGVWLPGYSITCMKLQEADHATVAAEMIVFYVHS